MVAGGSGVTPFVSVMREFARLRDVQFTLLVRFVPTRM